MCFYTAACNVNVVSTFIHELVPLQQSNPTLLAYSRRSSVSYVNLESVNFKCQNCFVLVSLSNDVDISYCNVPIYLSRLFPIGTKYWSEQIYQVPLDMAVKV